MRKNLREGEAIEEFMSKLGLNSAFGEHLGGFPSSMSFILLGSTFIFGGVFFWLLRALSDVSRN